LVRLLFSLFPNLAEIVYRQGLFRVFRIVWDYTFGLGPFPWIYVLVTGIVILAFRKWRLSKKVWSFMGTAKALLNGVAFLIFWFLVLWGYNYTCPTLIDKMDLQSNKTLTTQDIARFAIEAAENSRAQTSVDLTTINYSESYIRTQVEARLEPYDFPTEGRVRCRVLGVNGVMRRLGILGIYFPFVGEGHIDGSQLSYTSYFSMAHELSHGYGITDEGEANLVAWLALSESGDSNLEYFANLEWMRSALSQLYWEDAGAFERLREKLSPRLKEDLSLIRDNNSLYPPLFPELSEAVNNAYLETQGVEEGVASYGNFVTWVAMIRLEKNSRNP
jgi:hypothetical protein